MALTTWFSLTVEAGEIYHVTRNGVAVAELRPLSRRRRLTAEEIVARGANDWGAVAITGPSNVCLSWRDNEV